MTDSGKRPGLDLIANPRPSFVLIPFCTLHPARPLQDTRIRFMCVLYGWVFHLKYTELHQSGGAKSNKFPSEHPT